MFHKRHVDIWAETVYRKRIYFDGYLPDCKIPERLQRRRKHSEKLQTHYARFTKGIPLVSLQTQDDVENSGSSGPRKTICSSSFSHMLSPPFLVPCVVEALSSHLEYNQILYVTPGEADDYCAKYVQENGGVVLTSDSDLLVYNLGIQGNVCYLDDIGLERFEPDFCCQMYSSENMLERFSLSHEHGMAALAFEICENPSATLQTLLERAKKAPSSAKKTSLLDFASRYTLASKIALLDETRPQTCKLDARISEFVLRCSPESRIQRSLTSYESATLAMIYLPQLVDSPQLPDAYVISADVRCAAYSLMVNYSKGNAPYNTVNQHSRQHNIQAGKSVSLMNADNTTILLDSINILLDKATEMDPNPTNTEYWIMVSIIQEVIWSIKQDRQSLNHRVIKCRASNNVVMDWNSIHCLAQFHGSYYSMRMLKQISDYLIDVEHVKLPRQVHDLNRRLAVLPTLRDLPDWEYLCSQWLKLDIDNVISKTRSWMISGRSVNTEKAPKRKSSPKNITRHEARSKPKKWSHNSFDILADLDC